MFPEPPVSEETNPWEQPTPSPEFMQKPMPPAAEPPQLPSASPWDQGVVEGAFTPQNPNPWNKPPQVPSMAMGRLGEVKVNPEDTPFQGFGREEKSYGRVHDVATAAERGIRRFLGPGFGEAASKVATVGTMIAPGSGEYEAMQGSVKTKQAIEEGHYGEAVKEGAGALVNSTIGSIPGGALISKAAMIAGLGFAAKPGVKIPKSQNIADQISAEPGYIDTSQFKNINGKTGSQLGYWPGGFHTAPDGSAFYLKVGPSIDQVKNENLGAKIYALAGTPVAEVGVTHIKGQPGIASKMLPNSYQLSEWKKPYNELPGLHDNFVVDAWLANHDAPGTGWENNMGNIMVSNGVATRIDTGGSLSFKGSGHPKTHFNEEADEIFSMRDPNFSETNHKVYGGVSDENLKIGAQKVADVDPKALADVIARYGPSDQKEAWALYDKLLKRRQYIMDHFGVQPKAKEPTPQFNDPSINIWPAEWNKAPVKAGPEGIPEGQVGKNISEDEWNDLLAKAPPKEERIAGEKDFSEGQFGEAALKDQRYPQLTQDEVLGSSPPAGGPVSGLKMFDGVIDPLHVDLLTHGGGESKNVVADVGKQILKGPYGDNHWDAAVHLWKMAEHINPQTAEAVFRELPVSIQPQVGYALSALKNELGYSPWSSLKKDSGKAGEYPSAFNYYTTKTTAFPIPDHLKNSKVFQENTQNNAKKLSPADTKVDLPAAIPPLSKPNIITPDKFVPTLKGLAPGMVAKKLVGMYGDDTSNIAQSMYHYTKFKGDEFVDQIYKKLPEHLQSDINGDLTLLIEKLGDPRAKAFNNHIPTLEGQKILNFLEPIPDWQNYVPKQGPFEAPVFPDVFTKKKAEQTGHNTNVLFWKGHRKPEKYPEEIKDFSTKSTERANFLTHEKAIAAAGHYGTNKSPYVARADKAFRVDFEELFGTAKYGENRVHDVIEAARLKKADVLLIDNIKDYGPFKQDNGFNYRQTQYAFINQNMLRSPKAGFDPTKLHLAKPLLGLAGGGLFVYGASSKDDKMNRGGTPLSRIRTLARGGPGSQPWNVRSGSHPRQPSGMIKSDIPGRTDKLPMGVPPGSYILPADIPSALGQGNTMAGEKILGNMFKSGPYSPGAAQVAGKSRRPSASMPKMSMPRMRKAASGGEQTGNEPDIPIIAAGGEYVLHPEQVLHAGHGNMEAGHRVLDKFVLGVRKKNIQTLRNLKGPKK